MCQMCCANVNWDDKNADENEIIELISFHSSRKKTGWAIRRGKKIYMQNV